MESSLMRCFLALLICCLTCSAQTVSYWFQGWQRKPDAQQAQEYFMVPGTGISFTYATNRVIINATATNAPSTNYVLKTGDTMTGTLTNVSDLIIIRGSNQVATLTFEVPNPSVPGNFIQAILQFSTNNVFSISSVSNYIKAPTYITKVYGDGGGLTNVHASSVSGTLTNDTTGSAAFATNASSASFATNASNATNFWGVLNQTNLPPGVAMLSSNQTFTGVNTFTNSVLVKTNRGGLYVGVNAMGGTNTFQIDSVSTASALSVNTNGDVYMKNLSALRFLCVSAVGKLFYANNDVQSTTLGTGLNDETGNSPAGSGVVVFNNGPTLNNTTTYSNLQGNTITATNGVRCPSGSVTATNLVTSAVKWIDAQGQIFGALPVASSKTIVPTVDMGDGTFAYAFSRITVPNPYGNQVAPFTAEAPHTIAVTNATYGLTNLYVEPHFHGRPGSAPADPNTNIAFKIVYKACTPGSSPSVSWTNTVTYGLTAGSTNEILIEFGHLTYATNMPDIATTWPCTITTEDPGSNQYLSQSGASFIFRQPSFHVPVGNQNAIGSSSDNAP